MNRSNLLGRTRRLAAALVWVAAAAGLPTAQAATESRDQDPIADQAEDAFDGGDFDTLERLYTDATASTQVNAANGRHAVQSVRAGMGRVFRYRDLDDAYFREIDLLTGQWARERPGSVLATLLHARALYARALHVRGDSYWAEVPKPAQREFARLIALAEAQIAERAPLLMADTSTHVYLLTIGRLNGWTFEKMRIVAEDALAKSSRDEVAIYEELATALLPKWGGNLGALAAFVEEVDARTRERRGHEVYAMLYAWIASNLQGNLFEQMPARWPWIKEGFEALATRHPHRFNTNRLAYLACKAEDRGTAAKWLAALDGEPHLPNWSDGSRGGRENYEACLRWLRNE